MRRIPILLGVFGAVLLAAVGAVPAVGSGGHSIPDVKRLFGHAVRRVRAADRGAFRRAVVYEADGSTSGGHGVTGAAGVTEWQFVLDNPTPGAPYAYATIDYGPAPRGFGATTGHRMPYLEDVAIASAPRISLAHAVKLLRAAGYRGVFDSVTLRNPLGPKRTDPFYFFGMTSEYVSVDVVTGKVARVG
jgi:hypothetical protein